MSEDLQGHSSDLTLLHRVSRIVSTLTIGESADFAAEGGVINFTLVDNRLGFEINLGAASQTDVQISSKLLALAKIVNER